MKKRDLDRMLGLIDDDILNEARPSEKKRARTSVWLKIVSVAACFLLFFNVILLPAALFMNGKISSLEDEIGKRDEQIADILDKLNKPNSTQNYYELHLGQLGGTSSKITLSTPQTAIPAKYQDIIELLNGGFANGNSGGAIEDLGGAEASPDFDAGIRDEVWGELEDAIDKNEQESGEYEETTDLQEAGVIEGDIVKRTTKYIYHLNGEELSVYSIDGFNSKCVGSISLKNINEIVREKISLSFDSNNVLENKVENYLTHTNEMYISSDGKIATIVLDDYFNVYTSKYVYGVPFVSVIALNVENPKDIYASNVSTLFGKYESSRVIDDEIFVFTKHRANREYLAIPQYSDGHGFNYFQRDKIYTDGKQNNTYLLAYRMDEKTLEVNDAAAYLSYLGDIYVSGDNIYLSRSYYDRSYITEILRVEYSDGEFETKGKILLDGYIKDRYSLSEYNGALRVVTTENGIVYGEYGSTRKINASLYIVDVQTMALINEERRFAPDGETVRSVKFKGEFAYVCTSKQTQDPVFFFDLTDVNNIQYKDTGTIPGFSTSLIDFGDDLLGIGVDASWNLKLEIYRETETGVESVDYFIVNGDYSEEYKSYFINREAGIFGLGVYDYNNSTPNRYIVVHYDGTELREIINIPMLGDRALMRAVWVGDFLYIFSNKEFRVASITPSMLGMI